VSRPYTIMLVAVSLDGKISPRRQPGQTNPIGPELIAPEIMELHNAQRAGVDGIMVGLNCILLDDSRLTLRAGAGTNPTRVVLDGLAEMPPSARILDCSNTPTVVAVTEQAPADRVAELRQRGADIVVAGDNGRFVDLTLLMATLREDFGIKRLIVEGGGMVHRSMIADQLYDELQLIICPFVIGGAESVTPVQRGAFWPGGAVPTFALTDSEVVGDYLYVTYQPREKLRHGP
jgi:2,5-diamino-6-(ribosylamino)-4(3H)-pyrimidinone 5'-phosphate reductase